MKKAIKYIFNASPIYVYLKNTFAQFVKLNYKSNIQAKLLIPTLRKRKNMTFLLGIHLWWEMLNLEQNVFIAPNAIDLYLFKI